MKIYDSVYSKFDLIISLSFAEKEKKKFGTNRLYACDTSKNNLHFGELEFHNWTNATIVKNACFKKSFSGSKKHKNI